jgi:hypothetical protein
MTAPPPQVYTDSPDVLLAVRCLFSQHPHYQYSGALEIACVLRARGFVNHRPHEAAVEAALEALSVEHEVLA